MDNNRTSILIVGAGVFGISAALTASQDHLVTLLDDGFSGSASRGLGRIFRSQYPREEYTALALKAKALWDSSQFTAYFHERTKLILYQDGSQEEDTDAAWIDAHSVMSDALDQARRSGVRIVRDRASHLIWEGERCIGAATRTGESICADSVLLTLGGALPSFLAGERRPIDDICTTITIPWLSIQLDDGEFEQLKAKPITVIPGKGEYLPPNRDKKIWVNNPRSARVPDLSVIKHPVALDSPYFEETYHLCLSMLPELRDKPASSLAFHYCLDSITQSQDFIIDRVPNSEGLFMAGGGSCHAFKFFPILGEEIISILMGRQTVYSSMWKYETHSQLKQALEAGDITKSPAHSEVWPERTFPEQ